MEFFSVDVPFKKERLGKMKTGLVNTILFVVLVTLLFVSACSEKTINAADDLIDTDSSSSTGFDRNSDTDSGINHDSGTNTDSGINHDSDTNTDLGINHDSDTNTDSGLNHDSDTNSASLNDISYWTQGIARKVQPTTAAGSNSTVSVAGPKDSYQAYQIIIKASAKGLSGVHVDAGDLSNGSGGIISADNIRLFRQWFIDFSGLPDDVVKTAMQVPESSPTKDSRVPDPLIPLVNPYSPDKGKNAGQPFDVEADTNQPLFVDIFIPKETVSGTYTGTITITAGNNLKSTVPVTVEVWDLVLNDMTTVQTLFLLRGDHVGWYHEMYQDSTSRRIIVKRYEEMLHSHRIDGTDQNVPWPKNPTDRCDPPTSEQWTAFDAAVAPYMNGSYWENGVPNSHLTVRLKPGQPLASWWLGSGCPENKYTALAAAWAAHLKKRGWFEKSIVYMTDEPNEDLLNQLILESGWMQNADPDWKSHLLITKAPKGSPSNLVNEYENLVSPAVGIYTVNMPWYTYQKDNEGINQDGNWGRFSWDRIFQKNIQLWFYDSNSSKAPWPGYATNTLDGLQPAMLKWGSFYEQATGSLFWATVYWDKDNPWGMGLPPGIDPQGAGDFGFLYPGHHNGSVTGKGSPSDVTLDGPVPSYRLKALRIGLQDWALFKQAEALGLRDYVLKQMADVYIQLGICYYCEDELLGTFKDGTRYWRTDDIKMETIRKNVANAIIKATP